MRSRLPENWLLVTGLSFPPCQPPVTNNQQPRCLSTSNLATELVFLNQFAGASRFSSSVQLLTNLKHRLRQLGFDRSKSFASSPPRSSTSRRYSPCVETGNRSGWVRSVAARQCLVDSLSVDNGLAELSSSTVGAFLRNLRWRVMLQCSCPRGF